MPLMPDMRRLLGRALIGVAVMLALVDAVFGVAVLGVHWEVPAILETSWFTERNLDFYLFAQSMSQTLGEKLSIVAAAAIPLGATLGLLRLGQRLETTPHD